MPALAKYLSLLPLLLTAITAIAQNHPLGLITLGPDGRVVKFASGPQMVDATPLRDRDGHERYIAKDLNVFFVQITHFACADVLNVNGSRSWIIEQSRRLGISSGDVPMYTVTTECFNSEGAEADYWDYDAGINGWYTPGGGPTQAEPFRQLGIYRANSPDRDLEAWHYVMKLSRDAIVAIQAREAKQKELQGEEDARCAAPPSVAAYKVGGQVTPPVLIYSVDAEFSEEARRAKLQGVSVVSLIVDTHGRPQRIRVVRKLGKGLDEQAVAAVQQYKFKPSTYHGCPVPVEITIEVNFHIY